MRRGGYINFSRYDTLSLSEGRCRGTLAEYMATFGRGKDTWWSSEGSAPEFVTMKQLVLERPSLTFHTVECPTMGKNKDTFVEYS